MTTLILRPDAMLENADWPKRTDDRLSVYQREHERDEQTGMLSLASQFDESDRERGEDGRWTSSSAASTNYARIKEVDKLREGTRVRTPTLEQRERMDKAHALRKVVVDSATSYDGPVEGKQANKDKDYKSAYSAWKKIADKEMLYGFTGVGNQTAVETLSEDERAGLTTPYTERWDSTLDAAPKFEGLVFRGLRLDRPEQIEKFVVGKTLTLKDSQSTTRNLATAEHFSADGGALFRIKIKSGVDIMPFAKEYKEQEEVVARRGSKYKITGVKENVLIKAGEWGSVVAVIDMEEV